MGNTIRIKDIDLGTICVHVPSWVRWMATDDGGALWFFKHKPIISKTHKVWVESNNLSTPAEFVGFIRPPKDYTQELYTWS